MVGNSSQSKIYYDKFLFSENIFVSYLEFHLKSINQSISNIYSYFKTQEMNLHLQKVSKLQSKIRVEKRVIKQL